MIPVHIITLVTLYLLYDAAQTLFGYLWLHVILLLLWFNMKMNYEVDTEA